MLFQMKMYRVLLQILTVKITRLEQPSNWFLSISFRCLYRKDQSLNVVEKEMITVYWCVIAMKCRCCCIGKKAEYLFCIIGLSTYTLFDQHTDSIWLIHELQTFFTHKVILSKKSNERAYLKTVHVTVCVAANSIKYNTTNTSHTRMMSKSKIHAKDHLKTH